MNRRDLIKSIAVITGGVFIGGELFLTGCKSGPKAAAGFTAGNIALLDEVGETILPATKSPGAKAAKVGEFMKVYVTDCYTGREQEAFMKGLEQLEEGCKDKYGKSFMNCTAEERHEYLLTLEKESKEYNQQRNERDKARREQEEKEAELKEHDQQSNARDKSPEEQAEKAGKEKKEFEATPNHYYTMIKQLTLLGFFTSEVGATQALRHISVPGKYDGAYPYKKGDRAWAE